MNDENICFLLFYMIMNSIFSNFELKRAGFVALFKKGDIDNAIVEYKKYNKKLNNLLFRIFFRKQYLEEQKTINKIFTENMSKAAEKSLSEENLEKAAEYYNEIYLIDKNDTNILKKYINCLEKIEQYDLKLIIAKELLKLQDIGENYRIISEAYQKMNKNQEAIDFYFKYLDFSKKELIEADYSRLGILYFALYHEKNNKKYVKKSIYYFKKALETPDSDVKRRKIKLNNCIAASYLIRDYELSEKCWKELFTLGEFDANEKFAYSTFCIRTGRLKEWEESHDSRFEKTPPVEYVKTDKPRWTGQEDISNSTLLVCCEQGYGDIVLMWGYMKRLIKIAKKVIFVTRPALVSLFKNNPYNIEVLSINDDIKKIDYDYQVPIFSIPACLKLDKSNISVGSGYIKVDEKLREKFKKEYFDNKTFNIGIAFLGSPLGEQIRDIPLEKFKIFNKLKNVHFYCLTKDVNDDKLKKVFPAKKITNIAKYFNDFNDTAAAMENLDLVVSGDNCILNIAGAIGKRAFGIFNYRYHFRWSDFLENKKRQVKTNNGYTDIIRDDVGWYTCVKPFVNEDFDDWDTTMKKVFKEIEKIRSKK